MTRRRTQQRFVRSLRASAVIAGAGIAAVMKIRAARRARHRVPNPIASGGPPLEPLSVSPGNAAPAPSAGLSLAGTVDDGGSGDAAQTTVTSAGSSSTAVADATPTRLSPRATGDSSSSSAAADPARGARVTTRTSVLEALAKGGAMTAAEVALATGLGRATASSTLSRLTRTGEVTKADRGYQLPDAESTAEPTSTKPAPKLTPKTRSTKAKVLAALSSDVGQTAGDVAAATGLARGTVSTTLSKLSKSGEIVKAERGYRLPG
jgi:DNA-binding transcriptional ArsR family regulator